MRSSSSQRSLLREDTQFLLDSDERAGNFGEVPAFHFTEHIEGTLGAENDGILLSWQEALAGEIALAAGDLARAEPAFRAAAYPIASSFSAHMTAVSLANNLSFRDGAGERRWPFTR